MWYVIIICLLVISGFLISFKNKISGNFNNQKTIQNRIEAILINNNVNDSIKPVYSKKDLENKLRKLSETPAPTNLSYGAMCYEVGPRIPSTEKYVCPVCGTKTLYNKSDYSITDKIASIELCRKELKNIKGINIALDETQFCNKCSPNIEKPELCLLVNINNCKDTTKICDITKEDISIISEFLNDKLIHKGAQDSESPLVKYIDRLQKLLGIYLDPESK